MKKIDWTKIRNQFPAVKKYVYLNAASTSPIPKIVAHEGKLFYDEILENGEKAWDRWADKITETRENAAQLLNASPKEITFIHNTGHGLNIAAEILKDKPGEVLTMEDEYPTSTIPWIHRNRRVRFVQPVRNTYSIDQIEKYISKDTKILVTSHIQYSTGFKQDLNELGKLCKKHNLIYIVNATQSGGIFPVDVKKANIDFLVFAGYKWTLSGFGNGVLYINKKWLKPKAFPLVGSESVKDWEAMDNKNFTIRNDAAVLEIGAPNFAPIIALGSALKYLANIGQRNIQERIFSLNDYLVGEISCLKDVRITTPLDKKWRSGITLIKVPNPKRIQEQLVKRKILVSCRRKQIRISLHIYNNKDDIHKFVRALMKLLVVR